MSAETTEDHLSERAQQLLKVLVEQYIRDGQPVGSRTLSRDSGLNLSSATIRNVMADLEEFGFVTSPHTSAGRIPTGKGYRLFVDTLLKVKPLQSDEVIAIQQGLVRHAEDPKALVGAASQSPLLRAVRPDGLEDAAQLQLKIDRDKASALGVSFPAINTALSTARC